MQQVTHPTHPTHSLRRSTLIALLTATTTLVSGSAWAQAKDRPGENAEGQVDSADNTNSGAGNTNKRPDNAKSADATRVDKSEIDKSDMAPKIVDSTEERPEPPGGTALDENGDMANPQVVKSAGMGSEVAFATRGVVELGGSMGLDVRQELISFTAAPSLGYFIKDRLELSLIPVLTVQSVGDPDSDARETNFRIAAVLEPSYHLPLNDIFYAFAGVGLGVAYEEGPGVDFLLRPVLGLDIMVGRSGIFKPAGFVDVGFGNGAVGGGFLAGYTIML